MSVLEKDLFEVCELTERQRAVLDLVLELNSSKQIARILEISPSAVEQHIAAARKKLNAVSRSDLARRYLRLREHSGISTCGFTQVAELEASPHETGQDQKVDPVYTLSDVSQYQMAAPWQGKPVRLSGLEALDNRFGFGGRIGAIIALAATIAFLLLAMMSIAETLSRLI